MSERGRQAVEVLAVEAGLAFDEFLRLWRVSGWDRRRLESERLTAGWPERLRAEALTIEECEVQNAVSVRMVEILKTGPRALATKTTAELLNLVTDAKLEEFSESYDPFEHGGMLLCGPTGIGKSVAAIAIARRYEEQRERTHREEHAKPYPVYLAAQKDPKRVIRPSWVRAFDLPNARLTHGLGEGEPELVATAQTAEFLILDDIGWESARASANDVVTEILGRRYDYGLITLVTTGMKKEQFYQRYGSAVTRRIIESGGKPGKVRDFWPKEKGAS